MHRHFSAKCESGNVFCKRPAEAMLLLQNGIFELRGIHVVVLIENGARRIDL